jgi:hypothetical protein
VVGLLLGRFPEKAQKSVLSDLDYAGPINHHHLLLLLLNVSWLVVVVA